MVVDHPHRLTLVRAVHPDHVAEAGSRTDVDHEVANLNYWAYWTGEIGPVRSDDGFMTGTDPSSWYGAQPLTELLDRFRPSSGQVELNVHTAWTMLLAQPLLLQSKPGLRGNDAGGDQQT